MTVTQLKRHSSENVAQAMVGSPRCYWVSKPRCAHGLERGLHLAAAQELGDDSRSCFADWLNRQED